MKRDLHTKKRPRHTQAVSHTQTRILSHETYTYEKRPVYMKRDLYIYEMKPTNVKRDQKTHTLSRTHRLA